MTYSDKLKDPKNKILYKDSSIMKLEIKSNKYGYFEFIIDTDDYDKIKNYKWGIDIHWEKTNLMYVRRVDKNNNKIYIHNVIMNDKSIDHKDNDGLNNKKSNLRKCTNSENVINRKIQSNNTSGYKGVSLIKKSNKWNAYIKTKNKRIHLGNYESKIDAAKAYNQASIKYHGEFAQLNEVK